MTAVANYCSVVLPTNARSGLSQVLGRKTVVNSRSILLDTFTGKVRCGSRTNFQESTSSENNAEEGSDIDMNTRRFGIPGNTNEPTTRAQFSAVHGTRRATSIDGICLSPVARAKKTNSSVKHLLELRTSQVRQTDYRSVLPNYTPQTKQNAWDEHH